MSMDDKKQKKLRPPKPSEYRVTSSLRRGFEAVKKRWDTKEDRDRQKRDERYNKLSLEEARLDKKLRLRRLEKRVRQKKIKTSPLGRLLQEPEKPRKRRGKKRKKQKPPKKGFTLPPL